MKVFGELLKAQQGITRSTIERSRFHHLHSPSFVHDYNLFFYVKFWKEDEHEEEAVGDFSWEFELYESWENEGVGTLFGFWGDIGMLGQVYNKRSMPK